MSKSFEKTVKLNINQYLGSRLLNKSFKVTFTYENLNTFKINALSDEEEKYILDLKLSDYLNMKEKDFTEKVKTFKNLFEIFKTAFDKKRMVFWREYDNLKVTLYYTIIFEEKSISFELHPDITKDQEKQIIEEFYKESPRIEEEKNNDFKAEIISFENQFIDYGDRDIIKATIENTGNCSWPKDDTFLRCVPEFSNLLCEDYYFFEEVQPGERVDVELEFLKNDKESLKQPYFTMLHLNVYYQNFQPMLVLDFNDAFISGRKMADEEEIERYNQDRLTKISTRIENKNKARQTFITTRLLQQQQQNLKPIKEEPKKEQQSNFAPNNNTNNTNNNMNNKKNNNPNPFAAKSNPFADKIKMFSGKNVIK